MKHHWVKPEPSSFNPESATNGILSRDRLFDAGCRGFEYVVGGDDPTSGGKRIPRIEPDYADPIYLEKHAAFLKALGERYDGRPDVEFLDIGSYGVWGEWHTQYPDGRHIVRPRP